jgi:hypothetical protein
LNCGGGNGSRYSIKPNIDSQNGSPTYIVSNGKKIIIANGGIAGNDGFGNSIDVNGLIGGKYGGEGGNGKIIIYF